MQSISFAYSLTSLKQNAKITTYLCLFALLSIAFIRFILVVTWHSSPFILITAWYSTEQSLHSLHTYSPMNGHFHFAIFSVTLLHVCLWCVYIWFFPGYTCTNGIAESQKICMFRVGKCWWLVPLTHFREEVKLPHILSNS